MSGRDIVDAHVHFWDPARFCYAWHAEAPRLARPFGPAAFEAARGALPVSAIVCVEAAAAPGQGLAEAAWLAETAPQVAGIVAHAPVERGAGVEASLDRLAAIPGVCGVRRLIQGEVDPGVALEPAFVDGVRRVGRRGLAFDLCVKHWGLFAARLLAERCPGTRFVLDHIGKPGIGQGVREPWWGELRAIAALPNVVCKLSGVITEAGPGWEAALVLPYVAHALDCFGPGRVLFGSDWPVSTLTHGYAEWVALVAEALSGWSEAERRGVWAGTARAVYGLGTGSAEEW